MRTVTPHPDEEQKKGVNRVVFKFPLQPTNGLHLISVNGPSRVVACAKQHGLLYVWIEQDDAGERPDPQAILLQVFGTGQLIPPGYDHRGTVLIGPFVWHVYQLMDRSKPE